MKRIKHKIVDIAYHIALIIGALFLSIYLLRVTFIPEPVLKVLIGVEIAAIITIVLGDT